MTYIIVHHIILSIQEDLVFLFFTSTETGAVPGLSKSCDLLCVEQAIESSRKHFLFNFTTCKSKKG